MSKAKPLIVLFLLVFLFNGSNAQDTTAYIKKIFTASSGHQLPYRILFPEDYDSGKDYPLVLFLHGAGERGDDNRSQLIHGAGLFLDSTVRSTYPAIVVFPQCARESYWSSVSVDRSKNPYDLTFDYTRPATEPLQAVVELIRQLSKEEKVDEKRRYVMGLSMGGMGTFELVHRYPDMFAAAAPICGGGDAERYTDRVRRVAFWIFHGDADAVVNVEESRAMNARLQSLKVKNLRYTEYPGVNHNSWDNAFAEPELLSWMFSQRR